MKRTVLVITLTFTTLTFTSLFSLAFAQEGQTQAAQVTAIRVAHLAPDAQEVDILVDGEVAFAGVGAGTVSGYRLLPAGEHQLEVVPLGGVAEVPAATGGVGVAPTTPGATGGVAEPAGPVPVTPLVSATITAEAGGYYTVVATSAPTQGAATGGAEVDVTGGEVAGEVGAPVNLELAVFTDPLTALPPSGQALVRVVHASPDAPAVTIVAASPEEVQAAATGGVTGAGTGGVAPEGPQAIQGQTLVSGLSYNTASEYAALPAGSYQLQARTDDGTVALDLPDTLIDAGTAYTFYIFGSVVEGTLSANVSVDALIAQELE